VLTDQTTWALRTDGTHRCSSWKPPEHRTMNRVATMLQDAAWCSATLGGQQTRTHATERISPPRPVAVCDLQTTGVRRVGSSSTSEEYTMLGTRSESQHAEGARPRCQHPRVQRLFAPFTSQPGPGRPRGEGDQLDVARLLGCAVCSPGALVASLQASRRRPARGLAWWAGVSESHRQPPSRLPSPLRPSGPRSAIT
jgi:hypothetical protein